jgi:hypothetical protein
MGTAPSTLLGIAHRATAALPPAKSQTPISTDRDPASRLTSDSLSRNFPIFSAATDDAGTAHHFASSLGGSSSDSSAASSPRSGRRANARHASSTDSGSDEPSHGQSDRAISLLPRAVNSFFVAADFVVVDDDDEDDERAPLRPMRVTRIRRDRALSDHVGSGAALPLNQRHLQPSISAGLDGHANSTISTAHSVRSRAEKFDLANASSATQAQNSAMQSFNVTATSTEATPPVSVRTSPSFGSVHSTSSAYSSPAQCPIVQCGVDAGPSVANSTMRTNALGPTTILNALIADNNARQVYAQSHVSGAQVAVVDAGLPTAVAPRKLAIITTMDTIFDSER